MSKLTLHVPDDLIAAAKSEAASRKTSVSKLVSDFFRHLSTKNQDLATSEELDLSPRTRRLAGCVPDGDTEDYVDYLEQKHS